jgi:hypothetical protein
MAALMLSFDAAAMTERKPNESLNDVLSNTRMAIDLAHAGQYGRLSTRDIRIVNAALTRIEDVTAGKLEFAELSRDEQEALDEARERIDQILRIKNKNRIVCTKTATTGTRLAKTSCLTVGQREERARNARTRTHTLQHQFCVPGNEGSSPCILQGN